MKKSSGHKRFWPGMMTTIPFMDLMKNFLTFFRRNTMLKHSSDAAMIQLSIRNHHWLGPLGQGLILSTGEMTVKTFQSSAECGGSACLWSSSQGAETGRSLWIPGQPGLHCEYKGSQGYVERRCLKRWYIRMYVYKSICMWWTCSSVVECLPSINKDLGLIFNS